MWPVKRPSLLSETRVSCGEVELIVQHPCVYMDRRAARLARSPPMQVFLDLAEEPRVGIGRYENGL